MKEIIVAVVQFKRKILLLKRRKNKRYDPRRWEFISGFVAQNINLEDFAREQVLYETGLTTTFVKKGKDFKVNDEYGEWLIHPLLFSSESEDIKLRNDHETFEWIKINDLSKFNTVKELEKNLIALNLL